MTKKIEKAQSAQITPKKTKQKSVVEKKYSFPVSKSEEIVKNQKTFSKKIPEPVQSYSESLTGEVPSTLQKGEVKTLTKEKAQVPVIPQGIKKKKKEEKPLPFKPGVEVEQSPLAFNIGELENKETGNIKSNVENVKTEGETKEISEGNKALVEQPIKSNSLIKWEEGAQERKVISMGPRPSLPRWVNKEGLRLKVTLMFKVTPDGYTTDVKVFQSSGYSDVDAAVMESVRKILFESVQGDRSDIGKITYIIKPK